MLIQSFNKTLYSIFMQSVLPLFFFLLEHFSQNTALILNAHTDPLQPWFDNKVASQKNDGFALTTLFQHHCMLRLYFFIYA